ncbi:MAG: DUF938 domain-containing protein [Pseudomonadota bacterium]
MKKHAPAALRNRDAIVDVLASELPQAGTVLEIASGSGEHVMWFANAFPKLKWQPSDVDPEAIASIEAYRVESGLNNVKAPILLNAQASGEWDCRAADAIVCINMVHISPWSAIEGLFAGAAQVLGRKDLPLILYGPYFEQDVEAAPSNLAFDQSLRSRNSDWGIRSAEEIDRLASIHEFTRSARYEMPVNNLTLVYRSVG